MKKIILMLILMLGIGLMSCTTDQEDIKNDSEIQMKQTTIKVLPSEVNDSFLEFEFVRTNKRYFRQPK